MRKVIVLGGSSFVGRYLSTALGTQRVVATYCKAPFPGGLRFDSVTMDLTDIVKVPSDFSHAVLLLGDTKPDSCVRDPIRSQAVNFDGIVRVLKRLQEWGIKPIFTSSEFVFDGTKGDYVETDEARPILLYGRQKLEVERYIERNFSDWVVLRLAKVYGLTMGDGTIFTDWLDAVDRQGEIMCAADQRFSPVFVGNVVASIIATIERRIQGLFHCAGPRGLSRVEMLEILLRELSSRGSRIPTIRQCSIRDFPLPEPRPLDVTMRNDQLAEATAIRFLDPGDACRHIVATHLRNNERPE
jgi:dTDP-4-dehydrorhamnose reductase